VALFAHASVRECTSRTAGHGWRRCRPSL
jgi:hypothetical protein